MRTAIRVRAPSTAVLMSCTIDNVGTGCCVEGGSATLDACEIHDTTKAAVSIDAEGARATLKEMKLTGHQIEQGLSVSNGGRLEAESCEIIHAHSVGVCGRSGAVITLTQCKVRDCGSGVDVEDGRLQAARAYVQDIRCNGWVLRKLL
jgi:hypothetical protein